MTAPPASPQRLLLDSHVFLWWRSRLRPLAPAALERVGSAREVYVSLASVWELAIKRGSGKLDAPRDVEGAIADSGFTPLPITFAHITHLDALPLHHRDPFDRLLVAQAAYEGLTLVTHDRQLAPYPVPILWT